MYCENIVYVCMYVCVQYSNVYIRMFVCMCVYVCMYVCMYMYVYLFYMYVYVIIRNIYFQIVKLLQNLEFELKPEISLQNLEFELKRVFLFSLISRNRRKNSWFVHDKKRPIYIKITIK